MSAVTVLDQTSVPLAAGNVCEVLTQSIAVTGGTLYQAVLSTGVPGTLPLSISQVFVPTAAGGTTRYLRLTDAKADTGVPLTATATGGAMGFPGRREQASP
jgi:hypothetical protein